MEKPDVAVQRDGAAGGGEVQAVASADENGEASAERRVASRRGKGAVTTKEDRVKSSHHKTDSSCAGNHRGKREPYEGEIF